MFRRFLNSLLGRRSEPSTEEGTVACERGKELQHSEIGGLRWGASFWRAANATWPFAKLTASQSKLSVRLGLGPIGRTYDFDRHKVRALRKRRGLFSVGIIIEHNITTYPTFVLFWTFDYAQLKRELEQLGYTVQEA